MKSVNFFLLAAIFAVSPVKADCFDDAARYHGVNSWVLKAIAFQESSFNPTVVHKNSNDSEDYGLMGTNSVHIPELAQYGVGKSDLLVACKSIYVGAWRLKQKMKKHGNTCTAIGAYHSETPYYREKYIKQIRNVLQNWGIALAC